MFYFGVDYYPEHWPEERWPEDARLMAEAGINVVRLAEFAWSKMEPQEGRYDFDWLDRAISILASRDIRIILGTPTASAPPWLMSQYPDAFLVREDGRQATFGNRREYCPNNPAYHEYTRRIVTQMAEHYADHPAVIGWQIDNEFGDRCYCPICVDAFHNWVHRRYTSLDELNQKWGTMFWSHVYSDWDQIPVPLTTGGPPNPGLALDFFRFASDSYVAYQQMQLDILRQKCPDHLITHNMMGYKYDLINYFDLARSLDLVSVNHYRRTQFDMLTGTDPSYSAITSDTMRGLKRQNFWVMEQQSGPGGWQIVGVPPRPGELRLWAYQAIAHGADAIIFFRWRPARFGIEQYWYGILEHCGRAGWRYEEIKRMGQELNRAGAQIHGSVIKSEVAMVLSYDSRFAFQIQINNSQFSYADHLHQFYRALYRRHVPIDIVAPTADLSDYKLVVAPALHVLSEAAAKNLKHFVQNGGVLVVTPRTGVKDETNAVVDQPLPGLLAELCGIKVEDFDSLTADTHNQLQFTFPPLDSCSPVQASIWCDILKPNGGTVVARYTEDYYAGKPAITLNQFGQGQAIYVGTVGDAVLYQALAPWLLDLTGVQPLLTTPEGIEVMERWQGVQRLLFLLNHTRQEQEVVLHGRYVNLLDGSATLEGMVTLAPWDVLVLLEKQ
jgi:beta-galactosidase